MIRSIFEKLLSREQAPLGQDPQVARGYFGRLEYKDGSLILSGWMLLPEKPFDSIVLYINQQKVMEARTTERPEVAQAFPWIPHARHSGFTFSVHRPRETMDGLLDICLMGVSKGKDLAKLETSYQIDMHNGLPTPPPHLISRVAAHEDPQLYLLTGWQNYREFWRAVCRHTDPRSIRSMLDWGCGCGRIMGYYLKFSGIPRICGCDIDAEAIAWCQRNLKSGSFSVIPPYPPTDYADSKFDLVVSYSVFTHLPRDLQFAWLQEMQRILVPGGLFIASVHGEFATSFNPPGHGTQTLRKDGIYEFADNRLDGIAPDGYYRAVFQSQEYTLREWSSYFEILEYKERGAGNFQDLVVMKRRDPDIVKYESQ